MAFICIWNFLSGNSNNYHYRNSAITNTTAEFPSISDENEGVNRNDDVSKLTRDVENIKSTEAYKTRSFIHDDMEEQRESWVSFNKARKSKPK